MKAPTFPNVAVVGMHFRERDGVPAKDIVASFIPPLSLEYEREPENPYDSFAIKVMYDGQHIGYVEANQAAFISPWIDKPTFFTCTVTHMETRRNNLHPIVTFAPIESEEAEEDAKAKEEA